MNVPEFNGQFRFLSNFYLAKFEWEGIVWPHSEAAYQAAKFPRSQWAPFITSTPFQAKKMGQAAGMREDWDLVKIDFMRSIVREKFCQNIELLEKLLETGDGLIVEGNTWNDKFWGVCPPKSNNGRNELGKILMELRDEFLITEQTVQKQVIINYDHSPKKQSSENHLS